MSGKKTKQYWPPINADERRLRPVQDRRSSVFIGGQYFFFSRLEN
jgi:hypothetical protein